MLLRCSAVQWLWHEDKPTSKVPEDHVINSQTGRAVNGLMRTQTKFVGSQMLKKKYDLNAKSNRHACQVQNCGN
jgi:hypothetical protein